MERVCSMIGNTKVPPLVVRLTLLPECRKPYLFHRNDMSIRWAWMRNEQVRKGVVCVGGRLEGGSACVREVIGGVEAPT